MSDSNSTTAPTMQGPFLIQFMGVPLACVCLQAGYDGVDALVTIATVDTSGGTPLQQWYYGSDQRLYLNTPGSPGQFCIDFANPPANGKLLQLALVSPTDRTQMWQWSGKSNTSTFTNVGAPAFVIDNGASIVKPGNPLQIWNALANPNQFFALTSIPAFATQG